VAEVKAKAKDPGLEELNLIKKVPTGSNSKNFLVSSRDKKP
jgi:hypothetical protein